MRAKLDKLLAIHEFMHPRLEEICDTLPAGLGRWLLGSGWPRRLAERFTRKGRIIATTSLHGFLMLYGVAGMKRWRRGSLRYAAETQRIERWLAQIEQAAAFNPRLAVEVAQCQRLVKGYGDTHAHGLRNFESVMAAVQRAGAALAPAPTAPAPAKTPRRGTRSAPPSLTRRMAGLASTTGCLTSRSMIVLQTLTQESQI